MNALAFFYTLTSLPNKKLLAHILICGFACVYIHPNTTEPFFSREVAAYPKQKTIHHIFSGKEKNFQRLHIQMPEK